MIFSGFSPEADVVTYENSYWFGNEWDQLESGVDYDFTKPFFEQLKTKLDYKGDTEDLLNAWNAMILDIPEHRLDTLVEAKQNYNTFLLSNTNEPHIKIFEHDLYTEHGVKHFSDYFDKLYYSCRIGLRKPDKEIFEFVLNQNKLIASETVFIDDSIQHIKGAGECGINAFLLEPNMEVADLLNSLKLLQK